MGVEGEALLSLFLSEHSQGRMESHELTHSVLQLPPTPHDACPHEAWCPHLASKPFLQSLKVWRVQRLHVHDGSVNVGAMQACIDAGPPAHSSVAHRVAHCSPQHSTAQQRSTLQHT